MPYAPGQKVFFFYVEICTTNGITMPLSCWPRDVVDYRLVFMLAMIFGRLLNIVFPCEKKGILPRQQKIVRTIK